MNQDEAKKWLSFHEKAIIATRYKSKAIVYSNKSIQKQVEFNIENYEVRFTPKFLTKSQRVFRAKTSANGVNRLFEFARGKGFEW